MAQDERSLITNSGHSNSSPDHTLQSVRNATVHLPRALLDATVASVQFPVPKPTPAPLPTPPFPRPPLFDMDGPLTRPPLDFPRIKAEMGIGNRPILEALAELSGPQRQQAQAVLHRHEEE